MVKGETRMTTQTKIMFCTYGVLLRRLQDDPTLQSLDYVILDEIHGKYHSLFHFSPLNGGRVCVISYRTWIG